MGGWRASGCSSLPDPPELILRTSYNLEKLVNGEIEIQSRETKTNCVRKLHMTNQYLENRPSQGKRKDSPSRCQNHAAFRPRFRHLQAQRRVGGFA